MAIAKTASRNVAFKVYALKLYNINYSSMAN